jgi:hypothetical protein
MFAAGLLMLGMSFGVLTIVGTVWLGSLADEGIRSRTSAVKRHPEGDR